MNNMRFSIKNYRAIHNAEINLNGITILAGENGCGKSTLTRMLYYVVDGIINFEEYSKQDFIHGIWLQLMNLDMVLREMTIYSKTDERQLLHKLRRKLRTDDTIDADSFMLFYHDVVVQCASAIENYLDGKKNKSVVLRILQTIDMDNLSTFDKDIFINRYMENARNAFENYEHILQNHNMSNLCDNINSEFHLFLKNLDMIKLDENNVPILGKKQFGHLLGLRKVIYVDTPMAISMDTGVNPLWQQFNRQLLESYQNSIELTAAELKMKLRIQRIMHGSVQVVKDIVDDDELHYVREDNLDIPINEAATGLKSFAYIMRLLDNGLLNSTSLLIIDEPEAHLHPQWIVEFARVLVQLNKELGVRILIASHNPDMVAAIQAIARKENSIDNLTCYQAKMFNNFEYDYQCLESDISDIFRSFNIAMERIELYGASED